MAINKNKSYEKYILPSKYSELELFSKKFKSDMVDHVLNSIEIAIKQDLPLIEIFQFKNSDYVITLQKTDYLNNLENIFVYFLKTENYEQCNRLIKLQKVLKEKSEYNNNEKEKC